MFATLMLQGQLHYTGTCNSVFLGLRLAGLLFLHLHIQADLCHGAGNAGCMHQSLCCCSGTGPQHPDSGCWGPGEMGIYDYPRATIDVYSLYIV